MEAEGLSIVSVTLKMNEEEARWLLVHLRNYVEGPIYPLDTDMAAKFYQVIRGTLKTHGCLNDRE